MEFTVFYSNEFKSPSLSSRLCAKGKGKVIQEISAESFGEAYLCASALSNFACSNERIIVMIIDSLDEPILTTVNSDFKSLQKIVGGLIEYSWCPDCPGIDIICNEEGKLMRLPLNRALTSNNKLYDIIAGRMILASTNELGVTCSLSLSQVKSTYKYFQKPQLFQMDNKANSISMLSCSLNTAISMREFCISNFSVK